MAESEHGGFFWWIAQRKTYIVQTVMQRKLKLFGHICRMPDHRLIKTTIFGIIEGNNKRGRPKREWLDDIKEWCQKSVCGKPRPLPWTETSGGNLWTPLSTPTGRRPMDIKSSQVSQWTTTRGSYVHKPIMVKFSGASQKCISFCCNFLKLLLVPDKTIHKVFRIHKTI